jgi:hypothetical protein
MKTLKEFLKESSMTVGNNGYTQSGNSSSAAGFDKFLFPSDMDDLTQDYQTPGESGQAKWRFSDVYPVLKLSLNNSQGDGPSIDAMIDASKMFVDRMDNPQERMKKTFEQFRESWSNKYKKSIDCSNPKGFSQKAHCAGRKKRAK